MLEIDASQIISSAPWRRHGAVLWPELCCFAAQTLVAYVGGVGQFIILETKYLAVNPSNKSHSHRQAVKKRCLPASVRFEPGIGPCCNILQSLDY